METKERLMLKYALGGIVLSTSLHSAALSLGGSSGQAIIGRPLDISVRSSAPLAEIESAGCLLANRLMDQRRLEDATERQAQQLRDSQRRIDQLNERLEAMRAIERSLTTRPPAAAPNGARPNP